MLTGENPLPWEALSMYNVEALGPFEAPVLKLLTRDPTKRASMLDFYHACNSILAGTVVDA